MGWGAVRAALRLPDTPHRMGLTFPLALFTFCTASAITSLSLATACSFWYLRFCVRPRYSPRKGCCRLWIEGGGDQPRTPGFPPGHRV